MRDVISDDALLMRAMNRHFPARGASPNADLMTSEMAFVDSLGTVDSDLVLIFRPHTPELLSHVYPPLIIFMTLLL